MHVIFTRSHSVAPVASFSVGGLFPAVLLLVLAGLYVAGVVWGAQRLAEYWAASGHPALAEVVRARMAEDESERRALLREKIRLQNDAIADLQVRLWQLERSGAAIAANLNLPDGLFPPSDSLMTGVGENIQPILCRGEGEGSAGIYSDPAGSETGAVFTGEEFSDRELEAAADFADSLSGLGSEMSRLEAAYSATAKRAAAVEVLRRTIPMERPIGGKNWRTSLFGYRKDPFTGRRAFHNGYDYAARSGTPILAGADGVVVYSGRLGNYGNVVQLYHGGGVSTLYGHMRDIESEQWDFVRRGERIGTVGNTGRSTGPHLHYEIRFDNRPRAVRKAINILQKERGV